MGIKEFVQNLAEQFDETEVGIFTPETVFHELDEYSSIIALSIIAMIDEEYGVTINSAEMGNAVTIQDLYNIVETKLS